MIFMDVETQYLRLLYVSGYTGLFAIWICTWETQVLRLYNASVFLPGACVLTSTYLRLQFNGL